ncbi:methylmalonyl-CoA mutase family protein [Acuticoccus kandeliae]|uniref:methylmalonyl-CoA mutase family protein n=1 Tax=Acuticoccus kandeliae TaxID=2073160 RepID=UPI001300B3D5|nr:methylmalonyl-CoA mutase family protein [Acuticoccus kandeliae]
MKGAPFDTLTTHTADGAVLQPLYSPAEAIYSGREDHRAWDVVQRVDDDSIAAAQAREDLENGATGLSLVFAGAPGAFGRGLTVNSVAELDARLDGVLLDLVPISVEAGGRAVEALTLLLALAETRATAPQLIHAGIDPIGAFAASGTMPRPETVFPRLARAFTAIADLVPSGTILCADGRIVAEAGATPAEELAFALASAAATMRALDAEGVGPERTLPRFQVALTATVDQFATMAKLRAARRLFALLGEACGVAARVHLHATTAARMLSMSDPQTNLLRLTIAAFAAGTGGADSVTVLPFDGVGSPFARRMSRNIQSLLLEESHVAAIADPGAGSGAIEAYTDAIGEEAWALFQAHEKAGLIEEIASGALAERVVQSAAAAQDALKAGKATIIGVTRHPPADPTPIPDATPVAPPEGSVLRPFGPEFGDLLASAMAGSTLADLVGAGATDAPLSAPPITPSRAAAPFEG